MTIAERQSRRRERGARVLIWLYAVATGLALVLWLTMRWQAHRPSGLERLFGVINIPLSHSLVSFVVLLIITRALIGRKRAGLIAVAVFQLLGMYLGIVALARLNSAPVIGGWEARRLFSQWLDVAALLLGGLVLFGLWRVREQFPGHLRPGSWKRLAVAVALGGAVTVGVTWLLLNLSDRGGAGSEWQQLLGVLERGLGDVDAETARDLRDVAPWIPQVASVLISLTLIAAVQLFLRSAATPTRWSGSREVSLRRLLALYGDADSLGYFATRRDKSSIFSADGRAAVAYRVRHGVSLASGDPVGAPESWPAAIDAWKAEARHYSWLPGVVAASEGGARAYAGAGLSVITLGDEAILDPARFSLASTSMSAVRHAVRRAERAGLTVAVRRQQQVPGTELAEITAAAEGWRAGEADRGFSMALNRPADPADGQNVLVAARDVTGRLVGLLTFVPWGRTGVSLDVMRRSPSAPNGVTELMVAQLMDNAARLGLSRVSLNFCMFRAVYADAERIGAGSLTRFNYSLLGALDRFWQLERLYRSNQKYQPQWRPRYVCYDSRLALPQVALAVAAAEGFLPRLRRPRRDAAESRLSAAELLEVRQLEAEQVPDPARWEPRRSDQTRHRLQQLRGLAATGRNPYPIGVAAPTLALAELEDGTRRPVPVRVAGRVRAVRDHGGVVFVDLVDAGSSAQALLEANRLGREAVRDFSRFVGRGDLVVIDARPGHSRNGTASLLADSWEVAAKSLHPLPFAQFIDPEARLRQRSTDLLVHPAEADLLRQRTAVVRALRRTLETEGYLEVETPILHTVHGGATARPFRTFINAYGVDLSLRIAPELYLKRLLVGGLGAVFELGRNFRNEGADATHNPEFTSLEAYLPYGDYTAMRQLTERLVTAAACAVHGHPAMWLPSGDGPNARREPYDLTPPWPVVPVMQAVSAATGTSVSLDMDFDQLLALAARHGVHIHDGMGPGALVEELYAELVEPATVRPTFYTDFPAETSPLTGPHRSEPGLVERWDLVVNRMELGTAYSELTDPLEQRRRLTEQSLKAAAGDPEAMELDEDFLHALEIGMPPSGGLGIGVDRLVMLLTGTTIRSVLSFPFARPPSRAQSTAAALPIAGGVRSRGDAGARPG